MLRVGRCITVGFVVALRNDSNAGERAESGFYTDDIAGDPSGIDDDGSPLFGVFPPLSDSERFRLLVLSMSWCTALQHACAGSGFVVPAGHSA